MSNDLSLQLVGALRREFQLLCEEDDFQLGDGYFDKIQLGSTSWGTFFSCDKHGQEPTLNPKHRVIRQLLESKDQSRTHLYYLLSAVYSIVNRAVEEIEDTHERDFHAKILETLLEGREGRWTDHPDA